MTSERHGVAAKVIATVDDLDRIAADDEADVPALKGWRRELFGERALDLKHGRLALAIERGRVVAVGARLRPSEQVFEQPAAAVAPDHGDPAAVRPWNPGRRSRVRSSARRSGASADHYG